MLNMKKILGILLAFCFVLSVTAAAASAFPYENHNDKKKHDNHDDKKKYDNHHGEKKHYKQGYWGHKKVRHNPDRHHKFYWYTNDRVWFPGYWY